MGHKIKVLIVTDAEAILGIGDQGIGGIEICFGKAKVNTLCAGINPYEILHVMLDVGTNNQKLINNINYYGRKKPRIIKKEYNLFIEAFVYSVKNLAPTILLHWEDFKSETSHSNLRKAQCLLTFNDDMQGTAMVGLATILSALNQLNEQVSDNIYLFQGAGTAATGIGQLLVKHMVLIENIPIEEAF